MLTMMVMMMSDDGQQKDEETFKIIQHVCMFVHRSASVCASVSVSVCVCSPKGRPWMSDVSLLSGISGLSFGSPFLSPLLFFLPSLLALSVLSFFC